MVENFSNMAKNITYRFKKLIEFLKRETQRKLPRHIIIKLLKNSEEVFTATTGPEGGCRKALLCIE